MIQSHLKDGIIERCYFLKTMKGKVKNHMKKKLTALLLIALMAFAVAACGTDETATDTEATDAEVTEITYESIYDEYSQKIKDAAPGLVEEYNKDAADKAGDINALAELSNTKIEKLAEISVEGTEKMAELMLKNGDSEDVYTEWANKLNDVYMEESQQITDAYMSSVTGQQNNKKNDRPRGPVGNGRSTKHTIAFKGAFMPFYSIKYKRRCQLLCRKQKSCRRECGVARHPSMAKEDPSPHGPKEKPNSWLWNGRKEDEKKEGRRI